MGGERDRGGVGDRKEGRNNKNIILTGNFHKRKTYRQAIKKGKTLKNGTRKWEEGRAQKELARELHSPL